MFESQGHDDQEDQERFSDGSASHSSPSNAHQPPRPSQLLNFDSSLITTLILIVCSGILLVANLFRIFDPSVLAFSPGRGMWFPGLLSHLFTHADYLGPPGSRGLLPMHYLGNMCVLVFLGGSVERLYGRLAYLTVFLVSGLFAALAQASFEPNSLLIGASGALAGILACFVRHFPKVKLYIWGILPMPAWLLAVLWIAYNIAGTAGASTASIAFVAHLGGFIAGGVVSYILISPKSKPSGGNSQ